MSGGILTEFAKKINRNEFQDLTWEGTMEDYLDLVKKDPCVIRTSHQRVYDMILTHGYDEYTDAKKKILHYKFFDDAQSQGEDGVFGLDIPLMKFVNLLRSAAQGFGTERRVILLHGPVGSSKSTIVRMLKKGLERYSRTPEGALYTFSGAFQGRRPRHGTGAQPDEPRPASAHPRRIASRVHSRSQRRLRQTLPLPRARGSGPGESLLLQLFHEAIQRRLGGDDPRACRNPPAGAFRAGSCGYRHLPAQGREEPGQHGTDRRHQLPQIAIYGSDSDPRAFNFDGEFNVANRGIIEFVEVLKLDVAFLYDLLGASQEHKIKPKKFSQTDIDEVIIGHTNEPEYRKLQNNEYMEALRDRTVKVDIPYITRYGYERRIYERDSPRNAPGCTSPRTPWKRRRCGPC